MKKREWIIEYKFETKGGKKMPWRIIMKLIMFISSYAPLYIMIFIRYYEYYNDVLENVSYTKIMLLCFLIIAMFVSVGSLCLLFKSNKCRNVEIKSIERPDDTIISYIMTYIIPLLSVDSDNVESMKATIIINFLLFLVIGYLYIRLNLIYLNPLWAIFGFFSYRFEEEKILITNIPYGRIKKLKTIEGYYLLNNIFIAKKKDNKLD